MTAPRRSLAYRIQLKIKSAYQPQVDPAALRAAARAALKHQAARAPSEITVLIAGDNELRTLNRQFLGHDRPTDVLSFPARESDPATGRLYLGDVAISYPQARASAARGGHPVKAELQLLIVHGVLHLLGHDHAQAAEKARMWADQAAILRRLRSSITGPAGK
jgi:probable rRNA maturation factor